MLLDLILFYLYPQVNCFSKFLRNGTHEHSCVEVRAKSISWLLLIVMIILFYIRNPTAVTVDCLLKWHSKLYIHTHAQYMHMHSEILNRMPLTEIEC